MSLTYDEREAIRVLRKSLLRGGRAEVIMPALLKDMPQQIAATALQDVVKQLNQMLVISRAFQDAAKALSSKIDPPKPEGEPG